jgi:hypothetical protein
MMRNGNSPWAWVLAGLVIAATAGVFACIAYYRRRQARLAAWHDKIVSAYAEGSALLDSMSTRPADWETTRREDDFAQTLYVLREEAPDPYARGRVSQVLAALQAVRCAICAEQAPGGARAAEMARERLSYFGSSLQGLRYADSRGL